MRHGQFGFDIHKAKCSLDELIDAASIEKAASVDIKTPDGEVRLRVEQSINKRSIVSTFKVNGQKISRSKAKALLSNQERLLREENKNGDL